MKTWILIAAAVLLAAATVRAEDDMDAARTDLQSARAHLKAAAHDYAGHRQQALELVERALTQVNDGIKVGDRRDTRDEKKVQELQHKEQKLEHRMDKLKN